MILTMYQPIRMDKSGFWLALALVDFGDTKVKRYLATKVCLSLGITNWKPFLRATP